MITPREIRRAIEALPLEDRSAILDWLMEYAHIETRADTVHEPAAVYGEPAPQLLTVEEYFELEKRSGQRYEYVNGVVYAMTGVSRAHNLISLELAFLLKRHLRGGPCRVFSTDLKLNLKLGDAEFFYYPDVMVACDQRGWDEYFIHNPKLVIEVLSPSTQSTDVREKAFNYKRLPSVEEYVVVAQKDFRVTVYRRVEAWRGQVYSGPDAIAEFRSMGHTAPLSEIYAEVLGGEAYR
jgi:Uma2 family endonuclease